LPTHLRQSFSVFSLWRPPLPVLFIHCSIVYGLTGCHLSVCPGACRSNSLFELLPRLSLRALPLRCHSVGLLYCLLWTRQSLCTNPRCSKLRFKAYLISLYLLLGCTKRANAGIGLTIFSITKNIYLLSLPLIPRGVPSFLVPCPAYFI